MLFLPFNLSIRFRALGFRETFSCCGEIFFLLYLYWSGLLFSLFKRKLLKAAQRSQIWCMSFPWNFVNKIKKSSKVKKKKKHQKSEENELKQKEAEGSALFLVSSSIYCACKTWTGIDSLMLQNFSSQHYKINDKAH